ncbi:MAG TPA: hypothetical protein VGS59_05890 [Candidatus Acidoferrales bacterium]|nr:hypothetical protein [Candidatus Acidoferrales bacterium]
MNATGTVRAQSKPRGTVIKIPDSAPGIVLVNGDQKFFALENVWKSPVAPAPNMAVDVEFDSAGTVTGMTAVDSQQLAKERMSQLSGVAQERGKEAAKLAQQGVGALAARMGAVVLGSTVLVWIAWFFFPAAGVDTGGGQLSFTFWNLLGTDFKNLESLANTGGNHGLFSFLGLVAIAAPFAAPFLRVSWSKYLNAAPLAYIVIGLIMIFANEHSVFSEIAKAAGTNPFSWSAMLLILLAASAVLALGALKAPAQA